MDRYADHATVCSCGGDRTIRHNAIRDQVYSEIRELGSPAEREKAGLLPSRPESDGLPAVAQRRRPADIWIPGQAGAQARAIDFAVCSGFRAPLLGAPEHAADSTFAEYEDYKRQYQETDLQCRNEGMDFVPFVIEAHAGGVSPLARRTIDSLLKTAPGATEAAPLRMAQRISCALQREVARAVLRRRPVGSSVPTASGWDEVVELDG